MKLSEQEKADCLHLSAAFKKTFIGPKKSQTNRMLNEWLKLNLGVSIGDKKMRDYIHYIRCTLQVPVIASKKGYYLAENRQQMYTYLESLRYRINAQEDIIDSLELTVNNLKVK